ncbi:DNA internalization competence protein comec/rec2 [Rhodococcus ruber]|uniref:ComEC/Rec2 family competence protein n=1 Tax=Rhodococcus TaxID=1827 RepID=UPI00029AC5DB|nr:MULTISPECIES: ComEC/Rec2 family competence protein [Rhodococcus]ATQ28285.1 DNA internalization competence protein comec/rec2 [Rhodococcus ruber]
MTESGRDDARLVPSAAAAWAATALGLHAGWQVALGLAAIAALCAAATLVPTRRGRFRAGAAPLLAALVVAAGSSAAVALRVWAVETHPLAGAAARDGWATLAVEPTEDPKRLGDSGFGGDQVLVPARVHRADLGAGRYTGGGAVVVFAPAEEWAELLPGQRVTLRGRLAESGGANLTVAVVRADGPPRSVQAPSRVQQWAGRIRERLASASGAVLPPAAAGLLPGLVVGDTSRLPDDVRESFRVAGLTHLTAVSGANVSIVLGAVLLAVRGLGLGPRTGAALAAVALVAFVVVVRPSPSVLRAAAMGAIGLLALVTSRRRNGLPALAATVGVLLVAAPELATDAGFALSVAATAGLVLVAPLWVTRLRARGWPRAAAEVFAVSAAAFVVTAPIVAALSGTVSVVAIAANVLVAPVLPPLTVLGTTVAAVSAVSPAVAELLARGTAPMLWWILEVAARATALPLAEVPVPAGVSGAVAVVGGLVAARYLLRLRRGRPAGAPTVMSGGRGTIDR